MSAYYQQLSQQLQQILSDFQIDYQIALAELTLIVDKNDILAVSERLKSEPDAGFDTLVDICGVDYNAYEGDKPHPSRFASVYHLQSVQNNHRLRLVCYLDDELPMIDSVVSVWSSANWYEREAFDLFGILYQGHPDLRRILTDYGFIGHPLRKDFPVIGQIEMRYDPELRRVVYEPVSIQNRVVIPRVHTQDNRYAERQNTADR